MMLAPNKTKIVCTIGPKCDSPEIMPQMLRAGMNIARRLKRSWATLHFGEVKFEIRGEQNVFDVRIHLADLDPNSVRVDFCADGVMGDTPLRQEMNRGRPPADASGDHFYSATVFASRPLADFTARVIPHCDRVAVPPEESRILWQR
jgi:starch phosphorylase